MEWVFTLFIASTKLAMMIEYDHSEI